MPDLLPHPCSSWEIHTVFLHFLKVRLRQNLSASALADLIRASLVDAHMEAAVIAERDGFVMGFRLATQIIVDGLTDPPV